MKIIEILSFSFFPSFFLWVFPFANTSKKFRGAGGSCPQAQAPLGTPLCACTSIWKERTEKGKAGYAGLEAKRPTDATMVLRVKQYFVLNLSEFHASLLLMNTEFFIGSGSNSFITFFIFLQVFFDFNSHSKHQWTLFKLKIITVASNY